MSHPKMQDRINPDDLIPLVEERPDIWDTTSEGYSKGKPGKVAAWREICCILNPDFPHLNGAEKREYSLKVTQKWANIRDAFTRAEKKEKEARLSGCNKPFRPYIFKPQLMFLSKIKDISEPKIYPPENYPVLKRSRLSEENDEVETNPIYITPTAPSPTSTHMKSEDDSNDKTFVVDGDPSVEESHFDENAHLSFFKGILPSIASFNVDETLELQSNILASIQKIRRNRK